MGHLRGQDAVVVFSGFLPGMQFDTKHIALVNAAIEAGVKYFMPSEWALDTAGDMGSTSEQIGPTLPTNMVLAPKRVSHNYVLARAAEGKIKLAVIYAGVILESGESDLCSSIIIDIGLTKLIFEFSGMGSFNLTLLSTRRYCLTMA